MRKTKLSIGILAATLAVPMVSTAQDNVGELEEIVVTGSFIKRKDNYDTATPVDVVDQVDISNAGTPNVGEIIRNQTFNYGVDAVSNIIGTTGQGGVNTGANLRGLGEDATLVLMDGKRSATGNVKTLYPQIMLQRLETLTDGAAALYGTDAVGGVLNFIPVKSYDGFDIELSYGTDTGDGDYDESTISFITGNSGDNGDFVLSGAFRDRGQLKFADRPQYYLGGLSASGEGNPGSFYVPNRDVNGVLDGTTTKMADPDCGALGGTKDGVVGSQPTGFNAFSTCRLEFGANFDYIAPESVLTIASQYTYNFSDTLSFESSFNFARQEATNRGSPSNPGGRAGDLGAIPGDNPGNRYRAVNSDGDPLFAQDANGDGIPDRDPNADLNNDGLPDVILAVNPIVQGATDLPFYEDVTIAGWRPVGFQKAAGIGAPSYLNPDGSANGAGTYTADQHRFVAQLNYEWADTWTGYTDYVYHRTETRLPILVQSLSAIKAGVNCDLAVGGTTECFNPFGSQFLDPSLENSQAVWDQVSYYEDTTTKFTVQTIDTVATGELFEVPAGVASGAFGAQWRHNVIANDVGATENSGDAYIQGQASDYQAERDVYAFFGEAEMPIFDNDTGSLTINGAIRSEFTQDESDADLDSTDFKLAFRWELLDLAAIRGSWGTAFIAPTLQQLFAPATTGLSNVTDPLTGTGAAFKSRRLGGNPDLKPQEADVYNIGFTLDFLEGDLVWDFDYKIFEFTDRIARPLPQDVLDADFEAYLAAGNTAGDAAQIDAWIANNADPRIIRDSNNVLVVVNADLINAQQMTWKGFDSTVTYNYDTDNWGNFSVAATGTYVDEYSYTAAEGGESVNGAGRRNNRTGFVPPMPRVQANVRFGWNMGTHAVGLTGQYTHSYLQDGSTCDPLLHAGGSLAVSEIIGNALQGTADCNIGETVPKHLVWDLQYRTEFEGLIGDDSVTTVTVGMLNMLDEDAPNDRSLGGTETFLYDPRGQQWYIRLRHGF